LLVPVLVALLPALGVLGYATVAHRRLLVNDAQAEAVQLARLVAELHQRPVDGARGLLLALSQERRVAELDPGCSAQLARILAQDPVYLNMGAIDAKGDVFCTARPLPRPVNLADRRFARRAIASGGFGVGEYVVSRIAGIGSVAFGQAVLDEAGSLRAVAFASLDVGHLQRRLDALAVPEGAEVEVLDRIGVVITSRGHPERAGQPYDPAHLAALAGTKAPIEFPGPDQVSRVHALQTVLDPSGEPVIQVVAGLPAAAVLGPVNRIMALSLVAFGLVAVLALVAAGWVGEVVLVRQLRVLIGAARRISAGDIGARANIEAGRGELGDLGRAFDDMASSLERQVAERGRLEEQLRQSQKLEAIGRLAGGVAHDFNNLLTAVLSNARMIEDQLPAGHAARQDVAEIITAGERAAALTSQLLAFSRRQRLAPQVIGLADVVWGLEKMLRRILGETVKLEVLTDARGEVLADPSQLEQVIVNLVVNARDAMPDGGRLTITVSEVEAAERESGADPGLPEGPLAVLSVEDSGSGMDQETQARIFEPFFTTKDPGKGTGLGLSTVYGIVAQSGGAIRVRSAPGAGTEFRVCLRRHDGPRSTAATAPQSPRSTGGQETILLVEDDDAVRAIARRVLQQAGYSVIEAPGPRTAVEFAEGHPQPIDLLLTDVMLPNENGVSLSRRIVALRPGLRVAFMSGYTGEVADAELPAGAPFLPKPFTPDTLLATVRRALDG
jgi:signal transduction histidine kinase/CheY-like chemotaxis protein